MNRTRGKTQMRPTDDPTAMEAEAPPVEMGDGSPAAETAASALHAHWTFLTNHSHVLVLLARDPSMVLREVAVQVGITERAVQRIIADLQAGGFIRREKVGRQNHYQILGDRPLRHPIEAHRTIGDLLALVNQP